MSTSPMATRECWIYGEWLKIRMMVPGAAAPGKQPGKQQQTYTAQWSLTKLNVILCRPLSRETKSRSGLVHPRQIHVRRNTTGRHSR